MDQDRKWFKVGKKCNPFSSKRMRMRKQFGTPDTWRHKPAGGTPLLKKAWVGIQGSLVDIFANRNTSILFLLYHKMTGSRPQPPSTNTPLRQWSRGRWLHWNSALHNCITPPAVAVASSTERLAKRDTNHWCLSPLINFPEFTYYVWLFYESVEFSAFICSLGAQLWYFMAGVKKKAIRKFSCLSW